MSQPANNQVTTAENKTAFLVEIVECVPQMVEEDLEHLKMQLLVSKFTDSELNPVLHAIDVRLIGCKSVNT